MACNKNQVELNIHAFNSATHIFSSQVLMPYKDFSKPMVVRSCEKQKFGIDAGYHLFLWVRSQEIPDFSSSNVTYSSGVLGIHVLSPHLNIRNEDIALINSYQQERDYDF